MSFEVVTLTRFKRGANGLTAAACRYGADGNAFRGAIIVTVMINTVPARARYTAYMTRRIVKVDPFHFDFGSFRAVHLPVRACPRNNIMPRIRVDIRGNLWHYMLFQTCICHSVPINQWTFLVQNGRTIPPGCKTTDKNWSQIMTQS